MDQPAEMVHIKSACCPKARRHKNKQEAHLMGYLWLEKRLMASSSEASCALAARWVRIGM